MQFAGGVYLSLRGKKKWSGGKESDRAMKYTQGCTNEGKAGSIRINCEGDIYKTHGGHCTKMSNKCASRSERAVNSCEEVMQIAHNKAGYLSVMRVRVGKS